MSKIANPLYVVKKDHVEAANSFFDMIIKKLNLEPAIELLMEIFKSLFEQVNSYAGFVVIKELFDEVMRKIELFKKFSIV